MPSRSSQSPTSSAAEDVRYRQGSPEECIWVDCDDAFVVYHRPSGKTHLMNHASSRLLRDLLREPRRLVDIAEALAQGAGPQSDEVLDSLQAMLKRFEQLGLVDRV
jgi:PqqD family protein of HPr-rel-A system